MEQNTRDRLLFEAEQSLAEVAKEFGWGSAEWRAADQEFLELQRRTAEEAGLPYAVSFDLGVSPDAAVPSPVLISARRTIVTFFGTRTDPLEGVPRMRQGCDMDLAVLRFKGTVAAKMGSPNDEVLDGHPLRGSGLEPYEAHVVKNSPWIEELRQMNSVHRQYKEARWTALTHYMIVFHDETLECVASDVEVQTEQRTLAEILPALTSEAAG